MPITTNPQIDDGSIINQGADFVRVYSAEDSGTPIDITGAVVTCEFTSDFTGGSVFVATGAVTDGAAGEFSITVDAAATAGYMPPELLNNNNNIPRFGRDRGFEVLAFEVFLEGVAGRTQKECYVFGTAHFYPSAQT